MRKHAARRAAAGGIERTAVLPASSEAAAGKPRATSMVVALGKYYCAPCVSGAASLRLTEAPEVSEIARLAVVQELFFLLEAK